MEFEFIEAETKYNADNIDRLKFKNLVQALPYKNFKYVDSKDIYYTNAGGEFLRYRFSDDRKDKRAELTFKRKHSENNNIMRTEVNLRVDQSNQKTVEAFSAGLGYSKNFEITKECFIYEMDDATLVFYTVTDEDGDHNHFIEIEVKEGLPKSEDEAWTIIDKYEKVIAPLGISPQNRLKKSLFEMYRR